MAPLTWWTWVWASSRSWRWTAKPGVLRSIGSQRVGHNWATDLNWSEPTLLSRASLSPWESQHKAAFPGGLPGTFSVPSLSSQWLSSLLRNLQLSCSSVNSWIVSELEFYSPLCLTLSHHCSALVLLEITWLVVTGFLQSHLYYLVEAPGKHPTSADSFLENEKFTWPGKGVSTWRENKARRTECTKDFGQGERYFIIPQ